MALLISNTSGEFERTQFFKPLQTSKDEQSYGKEKIYELQGKFGREDIKRKHGTQGFVVETWIGKRWSGGET